MLEHILGDTDHLTLKEIQRVARFCIIIVSWRRAVSEPHYTLPLFGGLPRSVQDF